MRLLKVAALAAVCVAAALSLMSTRAGGAFANLIDDEARVAADADADAKAAAAAWPALEPAITRIAFGSCLKQNQPQPIWDAVIDARPDLFIFLGDNIYGDTSDMNVLRRRYAQLGANPGFRQLRETTRVLATWDDHDYGVNDVGGDWHMKHESQKEFLDFWGDGPDSPRRHREGVYDSAVFGPDGKRVQVILLDTRFFKTRLPRGRHDTTATLLGQAQWDWLAEQFKTPADIRIIASSIQFVTHGFGRESWEQFPRDRQRLLTLIAESGAGGTIILSGDRHHSELSRLNTGRLGTTSSADEWEQLPLPPYPIYDITASSLNRGKLFTGGNRYRIGRAYTQPNFGFIEIDWNRLDPVISIQVRDVGGTVRFKHDVPLSELQAQEPYAAREP